MAKNTKQIALIQHRRGKLSELPKQLNEGEFGLALDTNEVFIGNSTNPALAERIESNTFPYGNIQLLTEFTDNLQKITYRYKSNTDIKARLPIVIKGTNPNPVVTPNSSIIINGTEITFDNSHTALEGIIEQINLGLPSTIKAFTEDRAYISFITTETSLTLEDGVIPTPDTKGVLYKLGFGENIFTEVSSLPPERTLQEVLDDYVSIKSYGAYGDASTTNDGDALFNAIISLNKAGNDSKYYRTLYIPSGTYLTSRVIPMPYGTHLKGEGIQRTIIKSKDFSNSLFVSMDNNMNLATSSLYGNNTDPAKYITIEDLTIDVSDTNSSSIITLDGCHNVVFKNVEFIGTSQTRMVYIQNSQYISNSIHICFDSCTFKNGYNGIVCSNNLEHLVVKNCIFENIINNSILLNPSDNNIIINSIIEGNYFKDCGEIEPIIFLGENTKFISTVDNRFDEENSNLDDGAAKSYETLSNLNYTDILDPKTDTKKLLKFNFTQPVWEYIDYLVNPNGEYIVESVYNTEYYNGESVIKPLTNGIILKQGDSSNNDTFTIEASSPTGNLNITNGYYGNILLGADANQYDIWVKKPYKVGDIVQIIDGSYYTLYNCIKDIPQRDLDNSTPSSNSIYWDEIGTFNPKICIYKSLDLNGNYITNLKDNIIFKTSKDNHLEIDDSSSSGSYSYAERIATNKNAIPNVEYVNTIAQTTVRKKFDYNVIENNGKNKQEIIYFDPNIYGDFINMNFVNINIRRPFYPVLSAMDNALDWGSGLRYYSGDVVKAIVDDIEHTNFIIKVDIGNSWNDISPLMPTDSDMDGNGKPRRDYPDSTSNNLYAVKVDNTSRNVFYKYNREWYEVGSTDWIDLYPSHITVENALPNYEQNSIIKLYAGYKPNSSVKEEYIITLSSEPSLNNFKKDIDDALEGKDTGISVTINGSTLTISQNDFNKGELLLTNGDNKQALERIGFEIVDNFAKTTAVKLLKTYDNVTTFDANEFVDRTIWLKSEGISKYFACIYDNISSETFNQDLGVSGSMSYWTEIETIDKDGNPLKDLKYLSILAQANDTVDDETGELKENEQRLLFLKNIIEADRRDFHSIYQPEFEINKAYNKGDRVLYAGRYWECLKNNTSESAYDLHHSDLWLAVPEEGFNYHFDFERDLYLIDENDNIITSSDIVLDYNFANYHFFLMFYDEDQKRLVPFATDYNLNGLNYKGTVSSHTNLDSITGADINDCYKALDNNRYYFWNGDLWEELEPETNLCVSPAGNVTVTLNYLRGQGDD